jgi:hypothetical protein
MPALGFDLKFKKGMSPTRIDQRMPLPKMPEGVFVMVCGSESIGGSHIPTNLQYTLFLPFCGHLWINLRLRYIFWDIFHFVGSFD